MRSRNKSDSDGMFKGILMVYFVLFLHVLTIVGLVFLVFFFHAFIQYMFWIFLTGCGVIFISGFRVYRRLKREGRQLKQIIAAPAFWSRPLEISLLGGMASFRIGRRGSDISVIDAYETVGPQATDPTVAKIRDLNSMARLLEAGLITPEEFGRAKDQIL